jgi:septal ring factor EnvC (AmiA/AmiB activator)
MPVKAQAPIPANPPALAKSGGRKPWKKKSPVDVIRDQAEKLRAEIADTETELHGKKAQLKKFEEACKLFEQG